MKLGIIREGKTPPDKRVPFTPEHCVQIKALYPSVELLVQKSPVRAFSDKEYLNAGLTLVDDLKEADVIFGVKEVTIPDLLEGKTYFFFSHTIKQQPYNRNLLQTVLKRNIDLADYECLVDEKGNRLLGFGRYAGIVGTYNGFLTFGKRSGNYELKPAHECIDRKELEKELENVILPRDYKIAITGLGRVAGGAMEIFSALGIKQVDPEDYLTRSFNEPVFTQLSVREYFKKKDGSTFSRQDVYQDPSAFLPNFLPYAKETDLYVSCHFWDDRGPVIFTEDEMRMPEFRIRTVADISCDIAGPIPTTLRPSTIASPIYEVDRNTNSEVELSAEHTIIVMAVDNLPCELPRDASEGFGKDLIDKVLPSLLVDDKDGVVERAKIASKGELTSRFSYLKSYVEET